VTLLTAGPSDSVAAMGDDAPLRPAAAPDGRTPRVAGPEDAAAVAALLHDFNLEFDTPTPGVAVLTARLRERLAGDGMRALLIGEPAVGVALVSLRPSAWYDGPVGLLDELYVRPDDRNHGLGQALLETACALVRAHGGEALEINVDGEDADARRFYERHGFTNTEPGQVEPMLFYYREFADPRPA
jgi:ribosomal protein S18 acetylase RimI-like enzyme